MAHRRPALTRSRSALSLAALLTVVLAVAAPAHAQVVNAQPFVSGLSAPVAFVPDPTSASRHFVVEQGGLIRVVVNGVLQATEFLDLRTVVANNGEQGLLGLAFDPDYANNRRFYVYFTLAPAGHLVVSRFKRSVGNPLVADAGSRFDFRWGSASGPAFIDHDDATNHNGGCLQFGPDGYLYLATGDGGGGDDFFNNAQNTSTLLGKILRIDVNVPDGHAQGYQVPPDNPFVDNVPVDAPPEIWAFGLRNPWRFSFDNPALGGTGALIVADVGQNQWEEINYEPAGQGGRNYGWPYREGAHDHTPPAGASIAYQPLTEPVLDYSHSSAAVPLGGRSITGGYVYRGSALSAFWKGRYFFADFVSRRIWSVVLAAGSGAPSNIVEHTSQFGALGVSSFGVDLQGELFIVHHGGTVYRLCEITVAAGQTSFSGVGGSGTVTVTTQPGCTWAATANAPWLSIQSGSTGNGSGTVTFSVASNVGGADRTASVTVGGTTIAISQNGAAAPYGDIDNNGSADILWQHGNGSLAVWLMSGTTLVDGRPLSMPLSDTSWRIVASGDFDRDGGQDVVFQHQDGRLAIWLMRGTTLISGFALTPGAVADTNWKIRGSADMDRDGWRDLIWQHEGNGSIAVWLMTGTTLRDGRLLTPGAVADLNWKIVGVGDMNGDGHADLVWQHQTNGLMSAWLMNGLSMTSGPLLSPGQVPDTNWKIRALLDMNSDGRLDLIWQNQATGLLSAWLMDGLTRLGAGLRLSPEAVPDTNWQIVGPR
jgi:glucose/arabinose dehydrogenase